MVTDKNHFLFMLRNKRDASCRVSWDIFSLLYDPTPLKLNSINHYREMAPNPIFFLANTCADTNMVFYVHHLHILIHVCTTLINPANQFRDMALQGNDQVLRTLFFVKIQHH